MNPSYDELAESLSGLLDSETDPIVIFANASAFLMDRIPDLNWVGFYLFKDDELRLGPFQGKPACSHIPIGKGVCGTAFQQRKTIRVNDVHSFPGHIACDTASNAELVIPLQNQSGEWIGVLDLDSPVLGRFSVADQTELEQLAALIGSKILPE